MLLSALKSGREMIYFLQNIKPWWIRSPAFIFWGDLLNISIIILMPLLTGR